MSTAKRKKVSLFSLRSVLHLFGLLLIVGIVSLIYKAATPSYCANSISCVNSLNTKVENGAVGVFNGQKVAAPNIDLSARDIKTNVLGETAGSGDKHIFVDLTTQTLYAYQGQDLYMKALVSTGKWAKTPTGDFRIWVKLRATRMTGGQGADYYNLPNVPYVMYFSSALVPASAGFSLHGAYWHNNFGHPMSHGCVNMRIVDAQKLYDWASPTTNGDTTRATDSDPGTLVTIYGQAPL